jgi:hypothetical protein
MMDIDIDEAMMRLIGEQESLVAHYLKETGAKADEVQLCMQTKGGKTRYWVERKSDD